MFVCLLFMILPQLVASRCVEDEERAILDCSKQHLNSLQGIYNSKDMSWVKNAIFVYNNLTEVNITQLMIQSPNLQRMDLRHNPIKCITGPALVIILSDCPSQINSSTVSPSTTQIYATAYRKSISQITTLSSISTTVATGDKKSTSLVFIVVPVCVVCIVFVSCSFIVQNATQLTLPTHSLWKTLMAPLRLSSTDSKNILYNCNESNFITFHLNYNLIFYFVDIL